MYSHTKNGFSDKLSIRINVKYCRVTNVLEISQICQSITREGQATEYVTISRDTVPAKWTVYSVTPLKFEVLYSGGDSYNTTERKRCVHASACAHVDLTLKEPLAVLKLPQAKCCRNVDATSCSCVIHGMHFFHALMLHDSRS